MTFLTRQRRTWLHFVPLAGACALALLFLLLDCFFHDSARMAAQDSHDIPYFHGRFIFMLVPTLIVGTGAYCALRRAGTAFTVWRRSGPALRAALRDQHGTSSNAIIATNCAGVVVFVNESAAWMLGVEKTVAVGQAFDTLVSLIDPSGAKLDPLAPLASGSVAAASQERAFSEIDSPVSSVFPVSSAALLLSPSVASSTASVAYPSLQVADRPDLLVEVAVAPLRMPGGPIEGALVSIRDARSLALDAHRNSLTLESIAATPDALIGAREAGDDMIVTSWNEGARRLFGYEAEEMLGESVASLVTADRHVTLLQALRVAIAGERVLDRDLTVRSREAREYDTSLVAFPARTAPNDPQQLLMVLRDITERRTGERRVRHLSAQLVRRAQELQAIFDVAPVGMAIADSPDCLHVRPNLALSMSLGLDRSAEVVFDGGGAYSWWHQGAPLLPDASPLRAAVSRREVIEPMELEMRTPFRVSTLMAYAAPVFDQDDAVVGAIGVFVDITVMKHDQAERQKLLAEAISMRAAAEEASRLKEEFLATVSHELRTPLNAIHGWLEIMHRKPDEVTIARGLDVIRRNVRAQTRVIEDILDVSAFVTGKARLVVRYVDLADIARATVESLRPTAETKGVNLVLADRSSTGIGTTDTLGVTVAPEVAMVNGDPERLQQVIWNLLSNAVKFTPMGGHVTMSVYRDSNHFVVEVEDSGEGIDPAFLPYVFDRFRQADSSIERRHAGLGLGLAIVRHLIELHGGIVSVASEGAGRGATFRARLPVPLGTEIRQRAENDPAMRPVVALNDGGGDEYDGLIGRDVLIVDDDMSAAEMLAHGLADHGANVQISHTAADAMLRLAAWQPDAIVSDIGMPEKDGFAFVAEFRAAAQKKEALQAPGAMALPRVLIVAVTAHARPEDREQALRMGFDDYLIKPVTPSQVARRLVEQLTAGATTGTPAATA